MNHPERNMQEYIQPPSPFNKDKWDGLTALVALVATVEYVGVLLSAHATDGGCPASSEYAKAFPPLVEAVQEAVDMISEACRDLLPQLEQVLQQYEYAKLLAIANCSKEDCIDRENARKELGWDGDKQVLL